MDKLAKRPSDVLAPLAKHAEDLARDARAPNTRIAYRLDWETFAKWCADHNLPSLPAGPETIAIYLAHLDKIGRKPATIDRALVAISQAHKLASSPTEPTRAALVRETRAGLRRRRGTAQRKSEPLTVTHLKRICWTMPLKKTEHSGLKNIIDIRDRALLLIGWAGAFRRSELVALDIDIITEHPEGLAITITRGKTDQEGAARKVGIPFGVQVCPVRAYRAWLELLNTDTGPVFRSIRKGGAIEDRLSARSVDSIVKNRASQAGYSARFSSHSLRAGLATAAAGAGVPEHSIMIHTGHKSEKVFRGYVREGSIWTKNPVTGLL